MVLKKLFVQAKDFIYLKVAERFIIFLTQYFQVITQYLFIDIFL